MNIIFVGSNPSKAAKQGGAFTPDTRSYVILRSWIDRANIKDVVDFCNVHHGSTADNRPLSSQEIKDSVSRIQILLHEYDKIVALGKSAHKALELAGIKHLEMPHPSPRNRKLNSSSYVDEQIKKLELYANS